MNPSTRHTERLNEITEAWSNLRPAKSFAGMTLADFKTAVAQSVDARDRMGQASDALAKARADRDNADRQTRPILDRAVAAVIADADKSSDGALYEAMGYVRKSARNSGLTRRTATPAAPADAAPKAA